MDYLYCGTLGCDGSTYFIKLSMVMDIKKMKKLTKFNVQIVKLITLLLENMSNHPILKCYISKPIN